MNRKKLLLQELNLFPVYINDTSETSSDYFQISNFPLRLTAGKNLFKLRGHPTNLKTGANIDFEILDYNGDPIYAELVNYIDEDDSRIIAIYIYEDTAPGDCTLTIIGEASDELVPADWIDRYNVKWSKTVAVNPGTPNVSEIIFDTDPQVTVAELIAPQLNRTYANNLQTASYSAGTVKYFNYNEQPALELSNGFFTSDMSNGTITVSNPILPLPAINFVVSSSTYVSTIKKILSPTTALLNTAYQVTDTQNILNHTYDTFALSSYTLTYEATPIYTPTQNSHSFLDLKINKLEPATGDISRIKVFSNNSGTIGTWELINDIELEKTEIFETTTGSIYPIPPIGVFNKQADIDDFWDGQAFAGPTTLASPTLTYTTASILNAMTISSSLNLSNKNTVLVAKIKSAYAGTFVEKSSYKLTLDAAGIKTGSESPILSIYVSGSSFYQDPTDYFNQDFPYKFGKRIGELQTLVNNQKFNEHVIDFDADYSGTGVLILVVESGNWHVSNIHVTSNNDVGFSPNYTRIKSLVPTTHKSNNQLSFKVEYYNVQGEKSKYISYVNDNNWEGGNHYIDGDFSMLTGSMWVGDSLGNGLGISGNTNSGHVISSGYQGFYTGVPGFLMWSGSALPGKTSKGNQPYSGVGLELYQDPDNYFRYSTKDSELDIHTDTFFLGSPNTSYIEGFINNGNSGSLIISSSNFVLDEDGDVLMAGTIIATAGEIGGFTISNNSLSNSTNFFISGTAANNEFFISSSKFNVKASGDITGSNVLFTGGKIAGFTISNNTLSNGTNFFISGTAANNEFFISSSKFNVKANGDVTASSALFSGSVSVTGNINATTGNIGGFAITQNAITGSGVLISGSATGGTQFFISASKFNVKGNGDVTGSSVLFTGGKIGGFTISDSTLSNSTNFFISGSATGDQFFISSSKFNVKANGDVTASSALFSGSVSVTGNINANTGNIGGFAITRDAITGSGFYLSGSAENNEFFISSSKFNVKASGDVTGSQVLFTGGKIGSFTLTNNALSAGSTFLISSSVDLSNLSTAFFISSSKFNVRQDGTVSGSQVLFDGGKIGGFTIDSSKITGTNIVIDSAGSIQTSDYASDLKGWKISAAGNGSAEFENAKIRGTLSTAVFEKTSVNAVGGQLYVANSTTLTGSGFAGASTNGNYTPTQTTMSVENVTGFESGEILTAKKFSSTGFATEYMRINSASRDGTGEDLFGRIYVTRAYGNTITGISASLGEQPSAGQSYSGSQVIVSTGKSGSGFIRINANPNDQNTPYIDIVERTGSGIYDVALKARLGDLSGLANSSYVFGKSNPGFGLATDNVFLQGGIIANTGSIGGINMASSKLFTGATGTYNNPNTGFYLDANGQFSLKDKLAWDGTTLSIVGQIEVSNGSFVPGSSIYQHGPLTYWPRTNGDPPQDLTVLPNAYFKDPADNAIEYVMGPFGTQELAITCYPNSGNSGGPPPSTGWHDGDGGFNSESIPIDSGSAYMFVVYMKRTTNSTSGLAYFGLDGYNAAGTAIGVMSNAVTPTINTNPYFMYGDITPAGETAAASLDRWMLHVGYVYPSGSAYNANATNIVYDLTTGLTASYSSTQPTYTWRTGTTATIIRAYHFYNEFGDDNTKYQEIARPGIFKMDGTEPTIQSLLSNTSTGGSTKIDGSTITTGKIRSTNWSTTLGSELDLNEGTITLGGSTSPKFNVNASGDVTASSALFSGSVSVTGNINATTGNIGGFAITRNAITGSGFYLSGSATGNGFFISSSKFNVKANGDVTGSSVNFTGGTFSGTVTVGGTALTEANTLNSNTTATNVGLGSVQNLNAQSQAQTGINSGTTITGGGITLSNGGSIKGGQSAFNIGTGFFLGYESSAYKFSIGNTSTNYLTWDGSTFAVGGTIAATAGNIGGFTISNNSLSNGSNFYISGSATGNGFFISSSKFNVKANGDVTGSSVLFTGGKIAGFTISDNTLSNGTNFYISGSATGNGFFISSSNFNVKANGDVTASAALFSGNVTAVNFSKKLVTVTNANSGAYFQTISAGPPREINLIFNGSYGGEKTMVMEIACSTNPSLNINDIIVSNTGSGLMPQVEVIISQNNVTFDDEIIATYTPQPAAPPP